jgi:Protein of unknown function (DUF5818)
VVDDYRNLALIRGADLWQARSWHTRVSEDLMNITSATVCLTMLCAAGLAAQSTEKTREKTKVRVDDGKEITTTGCLERNADGGFMLTSRQGGMQYVLVGGHDLDKHLGHQIEVKGKTTDGDHGKVKVESKTKASDADTTREKAELKGDVHALSVKSLKMIASSCAS